jgi:hypothetical protein
MEVTDNQSSNSITRSFRLPENWNILLDREAKRKGVTVSSLLTQMVRKHVIVDAFNENRSVVMPEELFKRLITLIDDDDFDKIGDYFRSLLSSEILMRGMEKDLNSILWVLDEVFGNYYGWYQLSNHVMGKERRLYFQHNFGEAWSSFLRIFLDSFINDLGSNVNIDDDQYHITAVITK